MKGGNYTIENLQIAQPCLNPRISSKLLQKILSRHRTDISAFGLSLTKMILQIRMKAENLILYGLVDGKKKPQKLDAYLKMLVQDLQQLFEGGLSVFDACAQETFTCRAILLASVQDYMGYRDVGMQRVSGKLECSLRPSLHVVKLGQLEFDMTGFQVDITC